MADACEEATSKPVRVIPYVVPPNDIGKEDGRARFGLPADRFVFLVAFDTESYPLRKNPDGAVRAFLDAFPTFSESSPLMVLKFHGKGGRSSALTDLVAELRANPAFRIIDDTLDDDAMRHLQAACDCYVSLHRSEGFGLNIAECMAAGRLAIATDFSGNRDFTFADNSMPIPYAMRAVQRDEYVSGGGQWWAEPNHEAAVEAMRAAVGSPARSAALARKAKADMAALFSREMVGTLSVAALAEPRPNGRPILPMDPAASAPPPAATEPDYANAKVSRNAPCPCGSGKKFKHCHGAFL